MHVTVLLCAVHFFWWCGILLSAIPSHLDSMIRILMRGEMHNQSIIWFIFLLVWVYSTFFGFSGFFSLAEMAIFPINILHVTFQLHIKNMYIYPFWFAANKFYVMKGLQAFICSHIVDSIFVGQTSASFLFFHKQWNAFTWFTCIRSNEKCKSNNSLFIFSLRCTISSFVSLLLHTYCFKWVHKCHFTGMRVFICV